MGIHGIYKEIGSGRRIALSKFALDTFISKKRPLRLAVDISIWLFQIKSSKGGEQPALRTFYYRLLRLTSLAINPLFVFDGPEKPKFKRNRHTGPNICTIPEFLAKQLLKEFGLPYHVAPGEAEAECALLQRAGVVDAVLSEDVDTIMFGSGTTLRNWSAEGKGKVPTHVNVYDSKAIKQGSSGLDRDGMILIAMMSGGDYITEGIPGCGPKTACEAARAGFGTKLCKIERGDKKAFDDWKSELAHELKSNESKFFRVKHGALQIPDSFPNREILRYYTHPAVSSEDKIQQLGRSIVWEKPMQLAALRKFTEEAFKWETIIGAKKFIRTLAPALLVRELSRGAANVRSDLVMRISQARQHASTDNTSELRVSFIPEKVVDIDLSIEPPEESMPDAVKSMDENDAVEDEEEVPGSTQLRPYLFDPSEVTKTWIFEHFLEIGARQQYTEWRRIPNVKATKTASAASKTTETRRRIDDQMPSGAMNQFAKVTKPVSSSSAPILPSLPEREKLPFPDLPASSYSNRQLPPFRNSRSVNQAQPVETLDLAGWDLPNKLFLPNINMPSTTQAAPSATQPCRRSPLERSRTEGDVSASAEVLDLTLDSLSALTRREPFSRTKSTSKRKAQHNSPFGTPNNTKKTSSIAQPILISSSPVRQETITNYFSPSRSSQQSRASETVEHSPTRPSRSKTFGLPATQISCPDFQLEANSLDKVDDALASGSQQSSTIVSSSITSSCKARPVTGSSQRKLVSVDFTTAFTLSKSSVQRDLKNMKPAKAASNHLQASDGNKQRVRVRESLRGAFAFEDIDASKASPKTAIRNMWALQDVSIMDLTGDL